MGEREMTDTAQKIGNYCSELPPGKAVHVYHRNDGTWRIVDIVFSGSPLQFPTKMLRDGHTLEAALSAEPVFDKT